MPNGCPTRDDLAAYVIGKLSRERCEEIDMHLEECAICQAELDTCADTDATFLSSLRIPESQEFLVEVECAELLERVAAIGCDPSITTQRQRQDPFANEPRLPEIGPYRLLAKLGAGGMGTVYKAFHTKLERVVALKMLPADRLLDEQAIVRFQREIRAVGKLDHPNIVRATDAGDHGGYYFLVMEFVEGTDLSHLVRSLGPLPVAETCEIIRQAAVGLQHAYEHGLVHRDINPSNLMLTSDGTVKILDLGLALLPEPGQELTSTGQAMGTLDYMAPEQGGDSHEVDIRADVYSLGATLYKLLTGQAIFSGARYRTNVQKWKALALEEAPPIQSRREGISDELAAVVHRMLAREVEDRYATPQKVVDALLPFCKGANLLKLTATHAGLSEAEGVASKSLRPNESASHDTILYRPAADELSQTEPLPQLAAQSKNHRLVPPVLAAVGFLGMALMLAVFVLRLQTDRGELVITSTDPGVAVLIKQGERDVEQLELRPGENRTTLRAGQYEIVLLGEDLDRFKLQRDRVVISHGEHVVVTVARAKNLPANQQLKVRPMVPASKPLSATALVTAPAPIKGLTSWTLETKGERDVIKQVVFLPDGKRFATLDEHGIIRVRAAEDGQLLKAFLAPPSAEQLLLLGDEEVLLAVCGDGNVHRWQLDSGSHTITKWQGEEITGGKMSADGKRIAAWRDENSSGVFHAETGERIAILETGPRSGSEFAWSPDGTQIASGHGIWNASTGAKLHSLDVKRPAERQPRYAAWSPDGKQIITWTDKGYRWDAETGEFVGSAGGLTTRLIHFSPDGRYLATGSGFVTSVSDLKHNRHLSGHRGRHYVSACAWSPDSKHLVIGDEEGHLTLWSRETYHRIYSLPSDSGTIQEIKISPSGHHDASDELASRLVYVAQSENGRQLTYSQSAFEQAFGWKNDPSRAAD